MGYDRELAARTAAILGPSSAAHKAMAELKRRETAGETVGIWLVHERTHDRWIVGPPPSSEDGR